MALPKFLLHGPLDEWSLKEKLALACSVLRSGDQNWVSVSRSLKPFMENGRPAEWCSQKNCALQYSDLLDKVETRKRKRGDKGEVETPTIQIVRNLSIDRVEELRKKIKEYEQRYKKLKEEIESIKNGQMDDKLSEMLEQLQRAEAEKLEREQKINESNDQESKIRRMSTVEVESSASSSGSNETEAAGSSSVTVPIKVEPAEETKSSSDVLSSLLRCKQVSADDLSAIIKNAEHMQEKKAETKEDSISPQKIIATATITASGTPVNSSPVAVSMATDGKTDEAGTPSNTSVSPVSKIVVKPGNETETDQSSTAMEDLEFLATVEVPVEKADDTTAITEEDEPPGEVPEVATEDEDTIVDTIVETPKETESIKVEDLEYSRDSVDVNQSTSSVNVDDGNLFREEDPLSPASSISSKLSETDIKHPRGRPSRGRSKGQRKSTQRVKKSLEEAEKKEEVISDGDSTEDDGPEGEEASGFGLSSSGMFSESVPNSPLSLCSDTEDEKTRKNWKKSIMLVWRSAANHKYANVFLSPVTDDIAPGYSSVVKRPMDLHTIKRHIESGIIRTTAEFQRDMMLMFTNAIMYNSFTHNVHQMAVEMYNDVLEQIELFVSTQLLVHSGETKHLRTSRRGDNSDKEEDVKRRRASTDTHLGGGSDGGGGGGGGKTKKRKT